LHGEEELQMAQMIARIELQGSPTWETYDKLHALMEGRNWERTINSTAGSVALPHAMYQVTSIKGVSELSESIYKQVKSEVWTKPIVFIMAVEHWAMMP
jgi:hypothetical protein